VPCDVLEPGARSTMAWVTPWMFDGPTLPAGLSSVSQAPVISPFCSTWTTAISTIESGCGVNPVVSMSNTA
jgi:hypothetical protein